MAKRSNNIRSKKLQASKPYDVSNSFVKKVASRVTELLPQSIWPTKWFSSTNHEIHTHGDGRKILGSPHVLEKDEDGDQKPISTRARIPLDSSYSDPLFNTSASAAVHENRRLRNPLPISRSDIEDREAVAGPSGIHQQYSLGKSDSPKPKSRDTFCYNAKTLGVNGEDHSDSSESTSGCSSLPQGDHNRNQPKTGQLQVNGPESVTRTSVKRRRKEGANYSSMAIHSSHLFSSFGGYTSPTRAAPVPVGRRRNPSFNPDAFGSQSWSGEKTNIKDRIVNSPFYSGRTTYGGVSAYQSNLNKTENQHMQSGHRSIQVHPVRASEMSGGSSGMSNTARRILEALEMFSSPIQDAKKIPLSGNVNIKRRKVLANSDITHSPLHSSRSSLLTQDTTTSISHRLGDFIPPVRELVVPTVPDILAIRRRQKLQGSTVAAREVANETIMLPFSVEKVSERDGYAWPCPDNRSGGRHGGKIKSKEDIDDEPLEEPDLPNAVLSITSLPKFDFILPPLCPPSYTSKQIDSSVFKFSSPIAFSSASETLVSSNKFTFSSPLKATRKDSYSNSGPRTDLGSTTESVHKPIKIVKVDDSSTVESVSNKEKLRNSERICLEKNTERKLCDKGVNLQSMAQGSCNKLELSLGSSLSGKDTFGEQFKPVAGSWECETCMVRNNSEASQCAACETPKSCSLKNDSLKVIKNHKETKSGFGDRFKPPSGSWSCDACMIQNPSVANKCQACETPRCKGIEVTSSSKNSKADDRGFGDKFRKPDGAWDCSICLVRNKAGGPPKCVACEAPKPGTEPLDAVSTSVSSAKFSLGETVDSGFCFGMDKAGVIPKKDCSGEGKPTFTFGSTSNAVSGGFIFGGKSEEAAKISGFAFGTSATSESYEPDHSKNLAVPQSSPKFIFGTKEICGRTGKCSSTEFAKVQPETENKDNDSKALETKSSKEPEMKFGVGAATAMPSGTGTCATSSKSLVVAELKPAFTFASTEDKKDSLSNNNSFGSNSSVSKLKDGKTSSITFGSPTSPVNNLPAFGTATTVAGWNNNPLFKLDSSPKAPLFSQTTMPSLPTNSNSDDKHEDPLKAGPSSFRFGDASKVESTNSKQQEVPKMSSNFKFQEPPKMTSSVFSSEEKPKATSSTLPTLTSSTTTSNLFSSAVFSGLNNGKTNASNEEPNTIAASQSSDVSTAVKSSNAGSMFIFGSGSSTPATAFNLIGQKQPTQIASATKDEPIKPFANVGTTNVFGNLSSSKAPVFGSTTSSSPSPAVPSHPAAASETRSVTNAVFASPTSNPVFGTSVSTSVTSTSTATATTVSSTSSAFGSSIFGSTTRNFPAVASSALTFGSSTSTSLATSPAFGVAPSSSAVFGVNSTSSNMPFSFSGGAKPSAEEQQPSQATNAPFVFGGGPTPSAQPFTFSAATNKPAFSFGGSAQPVVGTSTSAAPPGAAPALGGFSFGDASKGNTPFGSAQPPTSIAGGTSNPFGSSSAVPVANITPTASTFGAPLGESSAPASGTFGPPTFNFGSSQSNPMFSFSNNQPGSLPTNIQQPSGFNFGQASQPSSAPQQVTFNPNMPPSFNFTGGATPQFTATPGGINAAPAANPMQRRFKKAVRRSQQPR